MEKKFLAKSDGESIVDHTEELIKNFERLFQMYPDIKVNKKLLFLACIYLMTAENMLIRFYSIPRRFIFLQSVLLPHPRIAAARVLLPLAFIMASNIIFFSAARQLG